MSNVTSASDRIREFGADTRGAALLEFSVFMVFFFSLLFGIIEFTLAFYQWQAATKAVQFGARLAAVSSPVASNLTMDSWDVAGYDAGDPVALADGFSFQCTGTDNTSGTCTNSGTYSAAAMNTLVFGRGNGTTCSGTPPNIGMCNIFNRITPANVRITYEYTGLAYAGRPEGPVPTIQVQIVDMPFDFMFLGPLVGIEQIDMPGLMSTVTGEDLSSLGD